MALEQRLQGYCSVFTGIKATGFSLCSAAFSSFDADAVKMRLAHVAVEELSPARQIWLAGKGSKGSTYPLLYFLHANEAPDLWSYFLILVGCMLVLAWMFFFKIPPI